MLADDGWLEILYTAHGLTASKYAYIRVCRTMAEGAGTNLTPDMLQLSLGEGLGLTSLDIVEIVVRLEKEFGIDVKAWEFQDIFYLGQFIKFLTEKIDGR